MKKIEFERFDFLFVILTGLLGFLFMNLAVFKGLNVGTTIVYLLLSVLLIAWFCKKKTKIQPASFIWLLFIIVGSCVFFWLDNNFLKISSIVVLSISSIYFIMINSNIQTDKRLNGFFFFDILDGMFNLPFEHFNYAPKIFTQFLKEPKTKKEVNKNKKYLLLGILFSLPVVAIIVNMLINADDMFKLFWTNLFRWFNLNYIQENYYLYIFQLFLGIIIGFYVFALFFESFQRSKLKKTSKYKVKNTYKNMRTVPYSFMIGIVLPILFVYLVFFTSQISYFLSSFQQMLPAGLNYAENARKGFFELCGVSFVNFLLIAIMVYFIKKEEASKVQLRIFSLLLCLTTIVLIIIALLRMNLYTATYGLTSLRIYVTWFIILLFIIFIVIGIKISFLKFPAIKFAIIASFCLFFALCFINPDKLIAKYNTQGYLSGKIAEIDMDLLNNLGNASLPSRIELHRHFLKTDPSIKTTAHKKLLLGLEQDFLRFVDQNKTISTYVTKKQNIFEFNLVKQNSFQYLNYIHNSLIFHEEELVKYKQELENKKTIEEENDDFED